MAGPVGHIVQCQRCLTHVVVTEGQDVHEALKCGCCLASHHHGQAASQTGVVCRPVKIYANAVVVPTFTERLV